ncbi:hypothetical protein K4F52_010356 [Lecanicillium sp. MT-2017a]|nr:hypothetical protein K4F52_010356 [Lecanicillium sp. MT-2017a]
MEELTVGRVAGFIALGVFAGVVTPLGLYDELITGDEAQMTFRYAKDTSPMGDGTAPRSSLDFNRKCGGWHPIQCPGSDTIVQLSGNGSNITADLPFGYNSRIPQALKNIYSSGTKEDGSTISNLFDIEWRNYHLEQEKAINNGSKFLVGSFRRIQSLLMHDAVEPVEGLLVDTKNGGVGFRHHAVPVDFKHGAEWSEDLLFIEPETQCVNTNLTVDFRRKSIIKDPFSYDPPVEDIVLTDRGGFVNLIKEYPYYNRNDTQRNPDLKGRAYKAAWVMNALTMHYFNVSNPNPKAFSYMNSAIGTTFPLYGPNAQYYFDGLTISTDWSELLNAPVLNDTNYATPPNPFRVSALNFTIIPLLCSGAGGGDIANISTIAVHCGLVYGAPRRQDGSSSITFDAGSKWTIPLYSCATAVKATIKSVDLKVNGTLGLKSLEVVNVKDKTYRSTEEKPLWGVEDPGLKLMDVSPLWGIIAPAFEGWSNLSTIRQQSLYLPGWTSTIPGSFSTVQNLAGVDFYEGALSTAYYVGPSRSSFGDGLLGDYSGRSNLAMLSKWQNLSQTEDSAGAIINLIWTDVAASAVIGTKGWVPIERNGTMLESSQVTVRPIIQRVRCEYWFAIPAFFVVAVWLLISTAVLFFYAMGHSSIRMLRSQLQRSSTGRILAAAVLPQGQPNFKAKTKDWIRAVGCGNIRFSANYPAVQKGDAGKEENDTLDVLLRGQEAAARSDRENAEKQPLSKVVAGQEGT